MTGLLGLIRVSDYISDSTEAGYFFREGYVEIEKIGGGTVGKEYVGEWFASMYRNGNLVDSAILTTPMPTNHRHAALQAMEFFTLGEIDA